MKARKGAPDAIVVGAGIIGLFSAWELARGGLRVTVVEREPEPRAASWAAGGILLPLNPWDAPAALAASLRYSQAQYPQLCEELRDATGVDPEYHRCGALIQAPAAPDGAAPLAAAELRQLEPALRFGAPMLRLDDAAQVRNPRLLRALRLRLQSLGVELRQGHAALERTGERLRVTCGSERVDGPCIVIAAGPWSADLLAGAKLGLPVAPVKGQMLLWHRPEGELCRLVITPQVYLVPRAGGGLIAGSTMEHSGFDTVTTPAARRQLHEAAAELLPGLRDMPPAAQWAGLRPATPDELPCVGALPGTLNGFVNTGHFRLGITLGPASGRLLADLVLGRTPTVEPGAFAPGRFG